MGFACGNLCNEKKSLLVNFVIRIVDISCLLSIR